MKPYRYILDDAGVPVPCDDSEAWGAWFLAGDRTIMRTEVDVVLISTVFLGIDHAMPGEPGPVLFETMVFGPGGEDSGYQERYTTMTEAIAGHTRAVDWVLALLPSN